MLQRQLNQHPLNSPAYLPAYLILINVHFVRSLVTKHCQKQVLGQAENSHCMRWVPVRQISPGMVKVKGSWSRPCLMEHLMGWDTAANNCHLCPRPLINSEPALCSLGWVKAMKNTLSSIMPIFVLSKNGFFIQELYIQLDKGSAGFKIIHEARFIQIFVEDPSLI